MLRIILYIALAPLLVAILIVACLWLPGLRKRLPQTPRLTRGARPDAAALVVLGASAALMLAYSVTDGLWTYWGWGDPPTLEYRWWTSAETLLGAGVVILCVLVLLRVVRQSPAVRVPSPQPRTWRSVTSVGRVWLLLATTAALLALVLIAGSASDPGDEGIYRWLTIDGDGGASASTTFFGWAYGIPVAVAALLLVGLAMTTLHVNAARPFLHPETVTEEEVSRSALSTLVLWFSTGVILATLARALLAVSQAGQLRLQAGGSSWETSFAALAPWLSWASYAVESIAYVLLLLVVTVAMRPRSTEDLAARESSRRQELGTHG